MPPPPAPASARDRLKAWLFRIGFAAAGVFCLWLGLSALVPILRATSAGAPLVAFQPHELIGFGLAVAMFAILALMFLPPRFAAPPKTRRSKDGGRTTPFDLPVALLTVAFVGLAAAVMTPAIAGLVAQDLMAREGYTRCPPPSDEDRYTPMRWVRAGGLCPH